MLKTPCREAQIGVWRSTEAASSECWIDRSEGPAEVPLGTDLKCAECQKKGLRVAGLLAMSGILGGRQDGCLDWNKFTVAVLEGAMPLDSSMRQAFPIIPGGVHSIAQGRVESTQ